MTSRTRILEFLFLLLAGTPLVASFTLWKADSPTTTTQRGRQQYRPCAATLGDATTFTTSSEDDDDDFDANGAAALRSITFCHLPKKQEPDLLADFLLELGACSAAVTDADAGTDKEEPLFGEPPSSADAWQESLQWAAPVWNSCNVTAHFAASTDLSWVVEAVKEAFPGQFPSLSTDDVTTIPHQDWVRHVQSSWKPCVVGHKFVLRFPWHSDQDVQQAVEADKEGSENIDTNVDDNLVHLLLQGGVAFGTGEHPTTQLCLQWLDRILGRDEQDDDDDDTASTTAPFKLLDYGAGSGVLGMAACRLNSRVQAVGIEIDLDACRIANANAVENNVRMRNYLPPVVESADDASKSLLLKAHAHARNALAADPSNDDDQAGISLWLPEHQLTGIYDACVANILAGPLCTLAPTIGEMLKEGGSIGMSGILAPQGQDVVDAYTQAGFVDMKVEQELGGWVLVTGRKR